MAPKERYLWFAVVNQGWIVAANNHSNEILRGLQISDEVFHYPVRLSPSGNEPAQFFGAAGLVEEPESSALQVYYDSVNRNNIDVLKQTADGSAMLWSKKDGEYDPPMPGITFDEFIATWTKPGLQRITTDPHAAVFSLLALIPHGKVQVFDNTMQAITGYSGDYADQRMSPTGSPPDTHWLGWTRWDESLIPAIKAAFPVDPMDDRYIVMEWDGGEMFWNNRDGDVTQPGIDFFDIQDEFNLLPVE